MPRKIWSASWSRLFGWRVDRPCWSFFGTATLFFIDEEMVKSSKFSARVADLLGEASSIKRNDMLLALFAQDTVLGFMVLGPSRRPGAYGDVDLLLLQNLCGELALSMKAREMERRSIQMEKLVSLGTMAAGLSHELRNPLVSVKTLTDLLQKNPEHLRLTEEFSSTVLRDVKRIFGIVDGVAGFARDAKKPLVPVSVEDVLAETHAVFSSRMEHAGVLFELQLESDLPRAGRCGAAHPSAAQYR